MTREEYNDVAEKVLVELIASAKLMGAASKTYIDGEVQKIVNVHGVDVEALSEKIKLINTELDEDDTQAAGIISSIADAVKRIEANEAAIAALQSKTDSTNEVVASNKEFAATELETVRSDLQGKLDSTNKTIADNKSASDTRFDGLDSDIAAQKEAVSTFKGEISQSFSDVDAKLNTEISDRKSEVTRVEGVIANNKEVFDTKIAEIEGNINTNESSTSSLIEGLRTDVDGTKQNIVDFKGAVDTYKSETETRFDNIELAAAEDHTSLMNCYGKLHDVVAIMDGIKSADLIAAFNEGLNPTE